jgi:hypothetical protein
VNLIKLSGSNIGYQGKDITFYANIQNKQILSRKIEVLDFFHDKNIGDVGKAFRMTLYGLNSGEPRPIGIFNIAITDIKINCPLDDDSVDFDPASVQTIYDGDHNKWIGVPK